MKGFRFIFFLIPLLLFLLSCEDDSRNFSSDGGMDIEFSSDTIQIDTLFTGMGSATKRFKVYNRNKKALYLESVELMNADKSGFRMLVDGVAGDKITNEPLYGGDSIFILVEITIDRINSNAPLIINDSIRFTFNGNQRFVQLEAIGQDAIVWHGKVFDSDTILTAEKPYLIFDSLVVNEGAKLTINPDVKLHFRGGSGMLVKGQLNAIGTVEQPVVFRGDRYDNILTNTPYNNIPGQWEGIIIDSLSFNNIFENVEIRGTNYGVTCKPSDPSIQKAIFHNTIIMNSLDNCLSAVNCKIDATNSLFANAKDAAVNLIGGSYTFLHCTIANYLSWVSGSKYSLNLNNKREGEVTDLYSMAPLIKCDFTNCIISASASGNIRVKAGYEQVAFEHYFKNCLIYANGSDDTNPNEPIHFVDNIWKEAPKFEDENKESNSHYSFALDSLSPAINKANPTYSQTLRYDIKGISRLSDDGPDIGCYEWVKKEDE